MGTYSLRALDLCVDSHGWCGVAALEAEFAVTHFAFRPAKRNGSHFAEFFEIQIDFIAELNNLPIHPLLSNRAPSIKKR